MPTGQVFKHGFDLLVENELYKEKTPLVVGQPQTHFYRGSMVIESNALKEGRKSHC